jgi:hypothetical protein
MARRVVSSIQGELPMIIAYHAVFTTYGTWLPNDPRGSYSEKIYSEELASLGPILYGRQDPQPENATLRRFWTAAIPRLTRPPFFLNDTSRGLVGRAFASTVARLDLQVPACAIMNDHVHLVVVRNVYRIEYLVNQLKGAATRALQLRVTPWARGCWKIFIDNWAALRAAAAYVQGNPPRGGLVPQNWDFLTPLSAV